MLKCELCGMGYNHLGSHIYHAHKIRAKEYKKMFGLDYKTALITPEIKIKKQVAFEKNREKYLSNLDNSEKYRFTKGHANRTYFSKESLERANEELLKLNSTDTELMCPFCKVLFNKLNTHMMNVHKIKFTRIR